MKFNKILKTTAFAAVLTMSTTANAFWSPGGWGGNNGGWGGNSMPWGGGNNGGWGGNNMPWGGGNSMPWGGGNNGGSPWNSGPWGNMSGPWDNGPWNNNWNGGPGNNNSQPWGSGPGAWMDPADPKGSMGRIWDDMLSAPNEMGEMPGGWTAPSISVPNPVEVGDEFEGSARKAPKEASEQMNNFRFN